MKYPVLLQVVGWTVVVAIDFALNQAAMPPDHTVWALYEAFTLGAYGLVVTSALWWLYRRHLPATGRASYLGALAGAVAGTGVWWALIDVTDWALGYMYWEPPLAHGVAGLLGGQLMYLFTMLAWHGALLAQRALARAADAERLAGEARLLALRYQLNPHFLFNALNSVIAMIDEDPKRAQIMLTKLSQLLRLTLAKDAGAVSTLGEELDVVGRYVEIERVRYEDKLHVALDVAETARVCAVPPLLVHALVENAVKHGMRTSAMPLEVTLSATCDDAALRIEVRNTGRLEPGRSGVGLRNVAERLDALYPGRHRFAVVEEAGTVRATVEIRRA
jgi:signal transduction histidine kinase